MNDKNLQLLVENKKPFEIVQDIDKDLASQRAVPKWKKRITLDPQTNQPFFRVEVELNQFYITNASAWQAFVWSHNKLQEISFETIEEAEDFLEKLQNKSIRLAQYPYGSNTQRGLELTSTLKVTLQDCIQRHKNGEAVAASFKEPTNY